MAHRMVWLALAALLCAAGRPGLWAQSADDQIMLPPAPPLDRTEIVPAGPPPPGPADSARTSAQPPPPLDVDDVIIYGQDRFRVTPGSKHLRTFPPLALPQRAEFLLARDNLYDQLPESENQFLRAQDWSLAHRFLSKCYASYGAWRTLNAKLVLGKQNIPLDNGQTIDLFMDVKHDQSWGHQGDRYYHRNESVRGTCLYQLEKHVETQSYLALENFRANQPNRYRNRLLTDYELGTLVNVYQDRDGSANVNLAFQTGALADSASTKGAVSYNSARLEVKGSGRWRGLLTSGNCTALSYGLADPALPDDKQKTNLINLTLVADGLPLYRQMFVASGGLSGALYTNYLTGRAVQVAVYPRGKLEYVAYRDWDLFFAWQPEVNFTTFKDVYQTNPYLNKYVELVPTRKYVDLTLGGEYRWPVGLTIGAVAGHERIANYQRYTYHPADSLYSVRVTDNSTYPGSTVLVNKYSASLKTKEFYRTLCEAFWHVRLPWFASGAAPVPFYPRYRAGVVVSGIWFYNIEQRYYLYRVGPQAWGPSAGQTLAAHTVFDFSVTRDLSDIFKVYAEGYAALERPFRLWAGYTEPQFKIMTGLRYRW